MLGRTTATRRPNYWLQNCAMSGHPASPGIIFYQDRRLPSAKPVNDRFVYVTLWDNKHKIRLQQQQTVLQPVMAPQSAKIIISMWAKSVVNGSAWYLSSALFQFWLSPVSESTSGLWIIALARVDEVLPNLKCFRHILIMHASVSKAHKNIVCANSQNDINNVVYWDGTDKIWQPGGVWPIPSIDKSS